LWLASAVAGDEWTANGAIVEVEVEVVEVDVAVESKRLGMPPIACACKGDDGVFALDGRFIKA